MNTTTTNYNYNYTKPQACRPYTLTSLTEKSFS